VLKSQKNWSTLGGLLPSPARSIKILTPVAVMRTTLVNIPANKNYLGVRKISGRTPPILAITFWEFFLEIFPSPYP